MFTLAIAVEWLVQQVYPCINEVRTSGDGQCTDCQQDKHYKLPTRRMTGGRTVLLTSPTAGLETVVTKTEGPFGILTAKTSCSGL